MNEFANLFQTEIRLVRVELSEMSSYAQDHPRRSPRGKAARAAQACRPHARLPSVAADAGSMLMHADNGGVNHLDSRIMGGGQSIYDAGPYTGPPPADEAVVASGVRTKPLRQIAPRCTGSQDPEDAIKDTTVVYPRNATRLVGQHRL